MKRAHQLSRKLIACMLLVSLFLQGCGNFSNYEKDEKLQADEDKQTFNQLIIKNQQGNLSPEEKCDLGRLYFETKNYEKAINLFSEAADAGNARAKYNLGYMYANGSGVDKDEEKAAKLYIQAADQGHPKAQLEAGIIYESGIYVKKDYKEALHYYQEALKRGNTLAKNYFTSLQNKLMSEARNKAKGNKRRSNQKKKRKKGEKEKPKVAAFLTVLPSEMWNHIFSYLKYHELRSVNQTNRTFRSLVQNRLLPHLRDAVIKKDKNTVFNLTHALGVDVNNKYEENMIALHFAVQQIGSTKDPNSPETLIIMTLLDSGADLTAKNDDGKAPADLAAINNNFELLELFLQQEDNISIKNNDQTNLHSAAYHYDGNISYIEELIDVASMKGLLESGFGKQPETISSHKRKKKYINARDRDGMTALHFAAYQGHLDLVEYLIAAGAGVNVKNRKNQTPLHLAAKNGRTTVVEELLKYTSKANINSKTRKMNQTPLHLASQRGHIDIVKLLLQKGANVNIKNKDGKTALQEATDKGHTEIVNAILNR